MIWRLPIFIAFWVIRILIFLPLAGIGIPLIYILAKAAWCEPRFSKRFDRTVLRWRTPWLFFLWDNLEDGVDGLRGGDSAQQWWADRTSGMAPAKRIWEWAAIRNPVDGLRWVPFLNPRVDPARLRFIGMDHEPMKGEGGWYFAWLAGTPYSCLRWESRHRRIWIGTKLKPEDRNGLAANDPRAIRCDFALQAKRIA